MEEKELNLGLGCGLLKINKLKHGVQYPILFSGFKNLDVDYTIVIDEGLPSQETYNVGSGITLGEKSFVWTLDTSLLENKQYNGRVYSNSNVAGVYFEYNIELNFL